MSDWPTGKYKAIYADPPWKFKTYSQKGKGRSPEQHYPCMSLKEICDLPVADLAADDCVLLMWTTAPFLQKSFKVVEAWGFTYKTMGFVWAKTNRKSEGYFTGLGYWTRSNAEFCLLCTKGKPKRVSKAVNQLVVAPRREHSRKPDLHEDIAKLLDGPYLELFARTESPGWDTWGNETQKFPTK
jgi:N6-adenosine-specific RNA methylase IME4